MAGDGGFLPKNLDGWIDLLLKFRPRAVFRLYGLVILGGFSLAAGGPWPLDVFAWLTEIAAARWGTPVFVATDSFDTFVRLAGLGLVLLALILAHHSGTAVPDRRSDGRLSLKILPGTTLAVALVHIESLSGVTVDAAALPDAMKRAILKPGERQYRSVERALAALPALFSDPGVGRYAVARDGDVYRLTKE